MASKSVSFQVVPSAGIKAYWIAVDKKDVPLKDGKGSITLQTEQEHVLIWWMEGNSGESLNIVGKQGDREIVNVKETKIPAKKQRGAGIAKFKL